MKRLLLLMSVLFAINLNAQIVDCTELFFSEYVEGYGQDKAIEVYNPTNVTIDLSNYQIERYSNGNTTSLLGGITSLTGMLVSGDAFVITHGETDTSASTGYCDPLLISLGDMVDGPYPSPLYMNGNDAMVLTKNGEIIDVIGKVGEDPGICWTDNVASGCVSGTDPPGFNPGTWYTTGHTLIRKSSVLYGDINGLDLFNPSLEWDILPVGTWNNLGAHTCDCINASAVNEIKEVSYIAYPNPANTGEVITVNTTANIESIDVINTLGEKVLTEISNKITTTNLARGTYIINIRFADGRIVDNKIIIE